MHRFIKSLSTAALATVAIMSGAQAFEKFTNVKVAPVSADADVAALASTYCVNKGFKGSEGFDFASIQGNVAVFNSVKCTFDARLVSNDKAVIRSGVLTIYPSETVKDGISDAINAAIISNAISEHGTSSSSGPVGGAGLSSKLGL